MAWCLLAQFCIERAVTYGNCAGTETTRLLPAGQRCADYCYSFVILEHNL